MSAHTPHPATSHRIGAPRAVRRTVLALLLVAASAPPLRAQAAAAQGPAALTPGARVRLTLVGPERTVARLVAVTPESLAVQWAQQAYPASVRIPPYGDTVAVALADIQRLEVSGGQRRHLWRGAGIGLLAGGGIGALAGVIATDEADFFGPEFLPAVLGTLGGAVGALVGGVIGAQPRERWQEVPLGAVRPRLSVGLSRTGGRGTGFAVRVSF